MRKILFFAILSVIFYSCDTINPKEEIPSYIQIDTQKVVVLKPSEEGTNNHGITDAWIYIDNKYQGNYEPPVKFPVLTSGNHKITIIAGIKTNGISATREEYPFYTPYIVDTVLQEDAVLKLNPVYNYIENAYFWVEDFQDPNFKIGEQEGLVTDTVIIRTEDPDNQGNYYGAFYVNSDAQKFNAATNPDTDPIYYFQANRRMFLEMQYKNTQEFWVGLYADGIPYPIELLNKSSEWNTIYIDLTPTIRSHPANVYMLFFNMEWDGTGQGQVFIDNVKLVNYE